MGRQRNRQKRGNPIHGWLAIDKPAGTGSTDVVRAAKRALRPMKVGHAGTLDPFATGILPLAFGEATKTIPFAQDATKDYDFTLKFGAETDSLDPEGEVIATSDILPTASELAAVLPDFMGVIEQLPPKFSALKVDGKRAYDLAREGVEFELKPRAVEILALEITDYRASMQEADFKVTCGKGTYVRSLARDIAYKTKAYGYLTHLRRTRVGGFGLTNAISFEKLESLSHSAATDSMLLGLSTALDDIPALAVTTPARDRIRQGQALSWAMVGDTHKEALASGFPGTVFLLCDGVPLALAEVTSKGVRPIRVFNIDP